MESVKEFLVLVLRRLEGSLTKVEVSVGVGFILPSRGHWRSFFCFLFFFCLMSSFSQC